MHKFNTVRAPTDKKYGIRNGDGKLLPWLWQLRSGKGEQIDSTKSKVYAANAARHCAKF